MVGNGFDPENGSVSGVWNPVALNSNVGTSKVFAPEAEEWRNLGANVDLICEAKTMF